MIRWWRGCALLGAALSTTAPGGAAHAAVHEVPPGAPIAPFLRRAVAGDTVQLGPGEYFEQLLLDKTVILRGAADGSTRLRGGYVGNVILVTAAGTVVEGLEVSEAKVALGQDMACIRIEADDVVVRNTRITRPLHGIYVKGGNRARIIANRIEGREDLIESDRGNGIHLWNSTGNELRGNEISGTRDGIYFSFANETLCQENIVREVRYGLHYMYSDDNTFEDNLFVHNVAGAALMYSKGIIFRRNVFAHCRGFRAYGILFQSMDGSSAVDNLIFDNSRGVFLSNSDHNELRNNDVVSNDLALQLNGSCDDNVIADNNFVQNLSSLLVDAGGSTTRWTHHGRGNHWSNYRGFDSDGDGLGERPHAIQNIFQLMEADTPQVRFYLLSPAAVILEAAEQALPILDLGEEEDPRPQVQRVANPAVPWSRLAGQRRAGSPLAACIYLLILAAGAFAWWRGVLGGTRARHTGARP